jgi:hypothetical protein
MTIPLDLITHRNLILVKQIYQRAIAQSALQHSDVDRILSLISFDLANETLLKNAIKAVDSRVDIVSKLRALIKTADEVFVKATPSIPLVPDSQKILRVRDIRNSAMHEAKYPTASDISDCRTYTKDFIQQIVSNVWGQDFASIRLTDLIRNPMVKSFLTQAEIKLEEGDSTEAVFQAIAGFDSTLEKGIAAVVGITPTLTGTTVRNDDLDLSNVSRAFESLRKVIALPVIGLDYSSYLQYKRFTKYLSICHYGGGHVDRAISGPEPSTDEAEFVVNYAVTSTIQIESFVGDIDKPFGGHSWYLFS